MGPHLIINIPVSSYAGREISWRTSRILWTGPRLIFFICFRSDLIAVDPPQRYLSVHPLGPILVSLAIMESHETIAAAAAAAAVVLPLPFPSRLPAAVVLWTQLASSYMHCPYVGPSVACVERPSWIRLSEGWDADTTRTLWYVHQRQSGTSVRLAASMRTVRYAVPEAAKKTGREKEWASMNARLFRKKHKSRSLSGEEKDAQQSTRYGEDSSFIIITAVSQQTVPVKTWSRRYFGRPAS